MRKPNILFFILAGITFLGITLGACNKPAKIVQPNEGTIYMPQAYGTRGNLSLVLIDSPQYVIFGAAYGGLKYPSQSVTVTFKIDTTLVAAYNLANGTSYAVLPAASYTADSMTTVIPVGQTSSIPLRLAILAAQLNNDGTQYMLPIKMTSISSGIFDSSLSTTYFSISKLLNIYDGSYHTVGTRHNYNADGSDGGISNIDDTRVLTTMSIDSCSINTISNLGNDGSPFFIRVNPDNTCELSGYLAGNLAVPVINHPGTTSTYDPIAKTFTVHYMYTNQNGTYRYMDEVWTPQ